MRSPPRRAQAFRTDTVTRPDGSELSLEPTNPDSGHASRSSETESEQPQPLDASSGDDHAEESTLVSESETTARESDVISIPTVVAAEAVADVDVPAAHFVLDYDREVAFLESEGRWSSDMVPKGFRRRR